MRDTTRGPAHFDLGLLHAHQIDQLPAAVLALKTLRRADAVVEDLRGLPFRRNRDANARTDGVPVAVDTLQPELRGLLVAPFPRVEGVHPPRFGPGPGVKARRPTEVEHDVVAAVVIEVAHRDSVGLDSSVPLLRKISARVELDTEFAVRPGSVAEHEIVRPLVRAAGADQDVGVSVVVDVAHTEAHGVFRPIGAKLRLDSDTPARQREGSIARTERDHVLIYLSTEIEIEVAVVVEICGNRSKRERMRLELTESRRDIDETGVAIVAIQPVEPARAQIEILIPVVIDVEPDGVLAVFELDDDPQLLGDFGECLVAIAPIDPRPAPAGDRRKIQATVVVEVGPADPPPLVFRLGDSRRQLDQLLLFLPAILVERQTSLSEKAPTPEQ